MKIQLMDCTLRDGGLGLEDIRKNGMVAKEFTEEEKSFIADSMCRAGMDIVEIGSLTETGYEIPGFAIYNGIEAASQHKPAAQSANQLIVGMYKGPDVDYDSVPEHNESLLDGVRVILRYSELEKSVEFCAMLAEKGYRVFVQPMLTMRYTNDQLHYLVSQANRMKAYALYMVDSYGYMENEDVERLYRLYDESLEGDIRIGFHAHNNMQMAASNVRAFLTINEGSERGVIVDACAVGMGQGAGNMQTELAAALLNQKYEGHYDLSHVLNVCELLEKFRPGDMNAWGYSPVRAVSAIHHAAYKYAVDMRAQKHMPLSEINRVFENMPEDLKHRYTKENLDIVLKSMGIRGV